MAALTVLPTWVPVTWRLTKAEEALATLHTESAAELVLRMAINDGGVTAGTQRRLTISHLSVTESDGTVSFDEGIPQPPELLERPCGGDATVVTVEDGSRWAVACREDKGRRVVAAWEPAFTSTWDITLLVFSMASLAGIITSLMVLRLLKPLSVMTQALDQLTDGRRGVRVDETGFVELDDLVARLNATSEAVEAREDAILSRIRVVQQLARVVAHEVRNPLQSLELLTTLITDEDDVGERREIADAIHAEIRALDQVVTRLLRDGSSGNGVRLQPTRQRVGPTLRRLVQLRTPEARRQGTKIEVDEISSIEISFDAALVGRSVENLLVNAMQAVPPGYGLVRISAVTEPDSIAIVVEDNGEGVSEEFGERVFDPHITTKSEGTGLGLALVKGVFDAHQGSIMYDRSPLGGARFIARLPRHEVTVDAAEFTQGPDRR